MSIHWLTYAPLESLAAHYTERATSLDQHRPIYMADVDRLYLEMVWAVGRYRFRDRFNAAVRATGYGTPSEPTDKERTDATT